MAEAIERPVTILSQGQRMRADFCLPENRSPAVIVSHGLESSKDGDKWLVLWPRLCESGIACLRFSYRGCGEGDQQSEGNFENTTLTSRINDYRAALDFMVGQGVDTGRLGAVGSSFGGMVAIVARDERIKAMVLMATPFQMPDPGEYILRKAYIELGSGHRLQPAFFHDLRKYDIGEAIKKIHCPVLIIQGTGDNVVPPGDAYNLYESANEPRRLEIIEGASHTFDSPEHLERVISLTLEWFKTYLSEKPPATD